jgi:hypothetical protein
MPRKLPRFSLYPFRWVLLTLYVLLVGWLLLPCFLPHSLDDRSFYFRCFSNLGWFFLVTQFLFVFGTVKREIIRPVRKRRLVVPLLVSAAMLILLGFSAYAAADELFGKPTSWLCGLLYVPLASWTVWGMLFFIHTRPAGRFTGLKRFTTFIFVGSLLELLATIPSHLIVIRRPGCLVGLSTMMSIAAGVYVALWCFGPFLVLLFLRPKKELEEKSATFVPDQPAGLQFSLLSLLLFTLFLASALATWLGRETMVAFWFALVLGVVWAWRFIRRIRRWEREGPGLADPDPSLTFRPSAQAALAVLSLAVVAAACWLPNHAAEGEIPPVFWPVLGLLLAWVVWSFRALWRWERRVRADLADLARPPSSAARDKP